MTFTIRNVKHRAWPVTVKTQVCDDAGQVTEVAQTFVAHWKPFTEDEFREVVDAADKAFHEGEGEDAQISRVLARNAQIFASLINGWGEEVLDDTGKPVPYSAKALCGLINPSLQPIVINQGFSPSSPT